jgi:hypothetical protein
MMFLADIRWGHCSICTCQMAYLFESIPLGDWIKEAGSIRVGVRITKVHRVRWYLG